MAAQDIAYMKAWGDVTADLLKRLEMKVDFAAVDWGTVVARWVQKSPPGQGGWHMGITGWSGADFDLTSRLLHANANVPLNGWANNPQIEAEIAAWYNATSSDEEKMIARRINQLAIDHVLYAPLGVMLQHHAWRKNVSGVVQAPMPLFWGVSKTA
jgi:peptide/nickel transport system substrate-binding protein